LLSASVAFCFCTHTVREDELWDNSWEAKGVAGCIATRISRHYDIFGQRAGAQKTNMILRHERRCGTGFSGGPVCIFAFSLHLVSLRHVTVTRQMQKKTRAAARAVSNSNTMTFLPCMTCQSINHQSINGGNWHFCFIQCGFRVQSRTAWPILTARALRTATGHRRSAQESEKGGVTTIGPSRRRGFSCVALPAWKS
jgi:hypothetical protein